MIGIPKVVTVEDSIRERLFHKGVRAKWLDQERQNDIIEQRRIEAKRLRVFRIKYNLCVVCGKPKEESRLDKTACIICALKDVERQKRSRI